jgi:hypothetical protein
VPFGPRKHSSAARLVVMLAEMVMTDAVRIIGMANVKFLDIISPLILSTALASAALHLEAQTPHH